MVKKCSTLLFVLCLALGGFKGRDQWVGFEELDDLRGTRFAWRLDDGRLELGLALGAVLLQRQQRIFHPCKVCTQRAIIERQRLKLVLLVCKLLALHTRRVSKM